MSTDLPYTDADLRAEAIAQHQGLIDDPEYFTVGEAMCDAKVPSSTTGETWETLLGEDDEDGYGTAQQKIHDLINGAANTSDWAVNLGADDLEPIDQHLELGIGDKPRIRIHFAFAPDMTEADRDDFIKRIATAMVTA